VPSPCDLNTGIHKAAAGDTVHVAGDLGPYLEVPPTIAHFDVTVIGEGQKVPEIVFADDGLLTVDAASSVARLDLTRASGSQVLIYLFGTGSRLRLESATGLPILVTGLLRDSFVHATGPSPLAVEAYSANARLRNVTAVADGVGSVAIGADALYDSLFDECIEVATVELRNVIARGAGGDLQVSSGKECPAFIDVAHSNFRAGATSVAGIEAGIFDLGGNQTTVDPLLGPDRLHQLAGSPTIDAGIATPDDGPTDLDGEARTQGPAPDIGADELLALAPPPDTTAPVGLRLSFNPRRFRPRPPRPASIATRSAKKRGTRQTSRVSYRLSEDANVRFIAQRWAIGRKKGKRCLVGKRARRLFKAKKCRKLVRVKGAFTHTGTQGVNRFRFSGYVRGRRLKPGTYRMLGVPTDAAGNRGRRFGAYFVIARR